MLPDIRTKIKQKLQKEEPLEESDVLYILVQSRKIMELTGKNITLYFYCNWVAHPKLTHENPFFSELRDQLRRIDITQRRGAIEIFGFLSLKDFRSNFRDFVSQQIDSETNLPDRFMDRLEDKLRLIIQDTNIEINIENVTVIIAFNQANELQIKNLPGQPQNIVFNLL